MTKLQKFFGKRRRLPFCLLLMILFFLPAFSMQTAEALVPAEISDDCIKIHFISVGQGDSILVELNEDTVLLIDAGSGSTAYAPTAVSAPYYEYLASIIGKGDIDYLIVSHPDADHINMLSNVITTYQVNEIFYNDYPDGSQTYHKVEENAEKEPNCILHEITTVDDSMFVVEKDGYKFTVFSAGNDGFTGKKDSNNMSLICLLEYGGRKVLFTGDAETEEEAWFISQIEDTYGSLDVDVLKAGHHGSDTSSSEIFLDTIQAEYAVISVGENNSYGHPKQSTLDHYAERNMKTYLTKELGTIDLYIDSDGDMFFDVGHTVTYTFDGEILASATVESITETMSYQQVMTLLQGTAKSLTAGTKYAWQADGVTVSVPYVPTEDVTLEYVAVEENVTRTIRYRYDYIDEENYREVTRQYAYGESFSFPKTVDGKTITEDLFEAPDYGKKVLRPTYVTEDITYYVKLTSDAVLTIDGEEVSLPYGSELPTLEDEGENVFTGYYLSEDGNLKYDGRAVNGLILYSKREKGKYVVTLSGDAEGTLYVRYGEAIKAEDLDGNFYWYASADNPGKITFPYTPTKDETLYGEKTARQEEDDMEIVLSDTEKIAVVALVVVAVIIALLVSFFTYKKKKGRSHKSTRSPAPKEPTPQKPSAKTTKKTPEKTTKKTTKKSTGKR